jgi:alginate O-acetyltransferase complex protein AlgI
VVFSSLVFLFLFLPVALGGYFLLPRAARNAWLLGASLLFYAWGEGAYVLVMVWTILFNWAMGLAVARASERRRRLALALAVGTNVLLLVGCKYANFLCDQANVVLGALGQQPLRLAPVHLPIGVSFFTFQAISYVVDVYRRDIAPQRDLITYGMYKAFWPQLIAGPIVRYRDVAGEVEHRPRRSADFAQGVERFVIGLAKKVLIANVVAVPADRVFALPGDELTAALAWYGAACYALQIYFDFSGYSDMAIGMARMCGFHFRENFLHPYVSRSIREFWRRWHISLSTWFRDYVYIPLGGSRAGAWRAKGNLLVVFVLCGFWHGASWTFLAWGLFHGVFLVCEHGRWSTWLERIPRPFAHAYALAVVLVGWVLFRAETLPQAGAFIATMFGAGARGVAADWSAVLNPEIALAFAVGLIASTPLRGVAAERIAAAERGAPAQVAIEGVRVASLAALLVLSVMWMTASASNPFIYFRF